MSTQLADHFNAEVVAGTIASKQDAIDYLTWTFFYRRLLQNPSYYGLESTEMGEVSAFLSDMVEASLATLQVLISMRPDQRSTLRASASGTRKSPKYATHVFSYSCLMLLISTNSHSTRGSQIARVMQQLLQRSKHSFLLCTFLEAGILCPE